MALGVLSVLTISGTTVMVYTSGNMHSADRSRSEGNAYSLAEAGMGYALSMLANAPDPRVATLLPSTTVVLEGDKAVYSGAIDANYVWTLTATGEMRNPTGAGVIRRTIHKTVSVRGINSGANGIAWSRFYQDDPTSCLTIDTVVWTASVSTRGPLCLVNGATIVGADTRVDVGGNVTINGTTTTPAARPASTASGWTSSTNIFTSNNGYATNSTAANADGAVLSATGFGFSIPATATIRGVQVTIERKAASSNTLKDAAVYLLKAGAQTGTNHNGSSFWTTSDVNATYGTTSDLWGTTLTPADVNASNFGVKLVAHNYGASAVVASADYVSITVTYRTAVAGIGTSITPVAEVNVNGTCSYNGLTPHTPCTTADNVYTASATAVGKNLAMPTVDFTYWWANAKPGPKHFCTNVNPGLATNFFDTDANSTSAPNHSIPGNGEMTPTGSDYTCQVVENGVLMGELSWNHSTHVLKISGTSFIDGNFRFDDDGQVVHYQGRGDIYSGGHDEIDEVVCAGGSGSGTCIGDMTSWDPSQNLLVLLSMEDNEYDQGSSSCSPSGTATCPNGHYTAGFQGVLYSTADCLIHQNFQDAGPVICNTITLPGDVSGWPTYFPYPVLTNLTDGQKYSDTATASVFELTLGEQDG